MKILIATCGVGIGHSSRDLALANYLKEYGHSIEFASYGSGLKYLRKFSFKTTDPWLNRFPSGPSLTVTSGQGPLWC